MLQPNRLWLPLLLLPANESGERDTGCPCRTALPPGTGVTAQFPGPLALWATLALPHTSKTSLILPLPLLSPFSSCDQAEQEEVNTLTQQRRGERKTDLSGGRSHRREGPLRVQGSGLGIQYPRDSYKGMLVWSRKGRDLVTSYSPTDSHLPLLCLPDQNALICPSSFVWLTLH